MIHNTTEEIHFVYKNAKRMETVQTDKIKFSENQNPSFYWIFKF
jgi:hypothetical protein